MMRAFLAVELSAELRAAIASVQDDLKRRLAKEASKETRIAWVAPSSIHLTLKFLGDMDEGLILPLRAAIAQKVAEAAVAAVPIERLGAFPRPQAPRVVWLGPDDTWERGNQGDQLRAMQHVIEETCAEFGFATDTKMFSPHLTLARVKAGERQVGQALAHSGMLDRAARVGTLDVGSIVLMKSELRPTGSVYTRVWELKVGERDAASRGQR